MRELRQLLERLCSKKRVEKGDDGNHVVVSMSNYRRQQRIRVFRRGSHYVFSTVVLGSVSADLRSECRRRLAIQAWTRNAKTELVNFTFDGEGQLVAEVRHPADHLDPAELLIYLKLLAREGDRFEYVLTGRDEH